MLFQPGLFYENLRGRQAGLDAFIFLLSCSLVFSLLAALFVGTRRTLFAPVFFLNAAAMPFFTAFFFYVAALFICRGVFTYGRILRVAAYANVTCLLAWIPGMAWLTGIWSLYLVGLGMVKTGNIGKWHALSVILAGVGLMLVLIQIIYPVLGGLKYGS